MWTRNSRGHLIGVHAGALAEEPTEVTVPVLEMVGGSLKETETTVPVLDVHELLDYIYTDLNVQCPPEETERFWEHLRSNGMPHATHFPGTDRHIPFSLYGDECVLGDPKDKVTGIFLSLTLWKPKAVRLGQFLLFSMQDANMVHEELRTLTPILRHIVWSCNVAFSGIYPETDAAGKPLPANKAKLAGRRMAGGCLYACAELKGDWKYHERVLRLQATPASTELCFLCDARAADSHLRYYNIDDNADWLATEVSTVGFINKKVRPGPLSLLPIAYCGVLEFSCSVQILVVVYRFEVQMRSPASSAWVPRQHGKVLLDARGKFGIGPHCEWCWLDASLSANSPIHRNYNYPSP